jgi:hypothetical protein
MREMRKFNIPLEKRRLICWPIAAFILLVCVGMWIAAVWVESDKLGYTGAFLLIPFAAFLLAGVDWEDF